MTMFTRILYLFLCINLCFGTNHNPVCNQLQNAVHTLCLEIAENSGGLSGPPGKKGPAGSPGRDGRPGPPGSVDYDRIDTEIDRKLRRVVSQHDAEKRELLLRIEILEGKVRLMENREGACEIKYNNKCFWLEALDHWVNGYAVGVNLCAVRGGAPANIYSKEHYEIIMRYLRSKMFPGREYVHAWIGMKTNPSTSAVSLSDGTPAPFMKWYPGYPNKAASATHMTIVQRIPSTRTDIGMHNLLSGSRRDAVLCEL